MAQNNPYVDDRVVHFGFQLGLNFMSFGVTDSELPIVNPLTGETIFSRLNNGIMLRMCIGHNE